MSESWWSLITMYGDPRYHPYIIYGDPTIVVAIQTRKSADCQRQIWLLNPTIRRCGPHYNNMKQPQMSVGKYYQRQGFSQILFFQSADPHRRSGDPAIQSEIHKVYQGDSTKYLVRTMRMPSISQVDRERIAEAIVSLNEEQGDLSQREVGDRAQCHHRKVKDWWERYGPTGTESGVSTYWATQGRRHKLTTTGEMMFKNMSGIFGNNPPVKSHDGTSVSTKSGNSGIPHLDSSEASPNDIPKEERLSAAVDILIKRYEMNWDGDVSLSYEWGSWPEWFILNRLPWLVSEDFFWPNNRSGSSPEGPTGPVRSKHYGYYRSEELTVLSLADLAISQCSD